MVAFGDICDARSWRRGIFGGGGGAACLEVSLATRKPSASFARRAGQDRGLGGGSSDLGAPVFRATG